MSDHEYYIKNRVRILAKVKAYAKANPEVNRAAARKYRQKNAASVVAKAKAKREGCPIAREKYIATYTLSNAIRDNRVQRPTHCSSCSKECVPEGHHTDYSQPLAVTWLCKSCHTAAHVNQRNN